VKHEPPRVLSTLNSDGSRRWIKPRLSRGRFLFRRRVVACILILIFTLTPYIKLNGKPLILLDLSTRHFTFFGCTFLPTDTLLLALLLVGIFVTVFLLTALFGRVWCGWACPQTVYMEFVFRPIERLFEGAPGRARGLLAGKPFSKPLKYAAYLIISMYLAHTFLAYFVGVDSLRQWVTQSPLRHPAPFLVMVVVTGLMMFDFAFFREQTCIVACPYGRFQAALLDRNSLIVSYDRVRGEPRGKVGRDLSLKLVENSQPAARQGDCVDCRMCVTTCPTGIDIRDGLQMECIGCTQCIDSCDAVMDRLNRPRGLIRYTSQAAIGGERRRLIRPRVVIYPAILLAVVTAFSIVLATRGPADVTVMRGVGGPFVELPGGDIGNPVKIKVVNRSDRLSSFTITLSGAKDLRFSVEENPVRVPPGQAKALVGMISAPAATFHDGESAIRVAVTSEDPLFRKEVTYRLMGPASRHHGQRRREGDDH
jgi:cytochrome c oxidase accessory protein FixG